MEERKVSSGLDSFSVHAEATRKVEKVYELLILSTHATKQWGARIDKEMRRGTE